MNRKYKIILCLLILILTAAGCSSNNGAADNNSGSDGIMSFFGFNTPAPTSGSGQKVQNIPVTATPTARSGSGGGLADLDWDSFDPPLVETDDEDGLESKNNNGTSAWEDDPFAYSFSSSSFDQDGSGSEQKLPVFNNPSRIRVTPTPPQLTFYPIYNPVFRPIHELPRTGFPTGKIVSINTSVKYTETNMTLSIPTMGLEEKIVIVPLVDDNFPVESLGENIGLLEGSGPGAEDLFVLAGHNHLNTQEQGPFAKLSALKESDLIFVRGAKDASRTFVVYANEKFASDDIEGLVSYARPGCMILITCEDESVEGGYLNRRVVFAEAKEE